MLGALDDNRDADIDLRCLFTALWERRRRILGVTVFAAGAALVATTMMTPSYRGEARILIEQRSPGLSTVQLSANDPVLDALNITSQAEVLQSSDLIKQVASELSLHEIAEFDPQGQALIPNPLVLLGLAKDPLAVASDERVVREFREKLNVYPVENSRVIAIEFSSEDPKLAAAIPNRMAQVYLMRESGAKIDTQSDTAKWLEPEIASLTEKVREAERKVAEYRAEAGLFQTTETSSFATQQLNDISTELARVRAERATAEARAQNVRAAVEAGQDPDMFADVMGSQVIQRLKESEASLQAQISDQSVVLMENHPRLRGLRAQLQGIGRQIDSETRKVLASLDNEADVARLRENQLVQSLEALKADSARVGAEEVGLRALEREAAAQRQLLETYLSRYREAASRQEPGAAPADARIVSGAIVPLEPYFPKTVPIVIVVSLASLIISAMVIMLGELFSGRAFRYPGEEVDAAISEDAPAIHHIQAQAVAEFQRLNATSSGDVEQNDMDGLGQEENVPVRDEEIPQPGDDDKDDPFGIETVATHLLRYGASVAIAVSPDGDAGSAATVMLAREVADRGRSVIIIDMTGGACPSQMMIEDSLPGITDLLCGQAAFGEAIHRDRHSDAHIIPQGTADAATAMRGVDRLTMIMDALADAYDLVLLECGATDVDGVCRLGRSRDAEILFTVVDPDDSALPGLLESFTSQHYANLSVMKAGTLTRLSDRSRAA